MAWVESWGIGARIFLKWWGALLWDVYVNSTFAPPSPVWDLWVPGRVRVRVPPMHIPLHFLDGCLEQFQFGCELPKFSLYPD